MTFETMWAADALEVTAPDGSTVRVLPRLTGGSLARFELPPGGTSIPVAHRTVEEIWYVVSGRGEMWRRDGEREEIVSAERGLSITIPRGTHFQFRCTGDETFISVGVTMPPWPGEDEAYPVDGPWEPTVAP